MTPMRNFNRFVIVAAIAASAASCGDALRQSRSPVLLVINTLSGAPGGGRGSGTPSATLLSDVQVLLTTPAPCTPATPCPTIFNDFGQATLSLAPKDVLVAPTSNNSVTISRYTVVYRRNDGRNTPGVDVPYPIDGAITVTLSGATPAPVTFELVRHVAKGETPLVQLVSNPNVIQTIAEVTFYGRDLVGNDISVKGSMVIEFGNFGDQ
jgi:hypothetical protein